MQNVAGAGATLKARHFALVVTIAIAEGVAPPITVRAGDGSGVGLGATVG